MKLSWLRHLVSVLMIVAALTGATSGFAAPMAHPCAGMASMDDCPDSHSDPTAVPRHCDSLLCGAIQLTPCFSVVPAAVRAAVDFVPQPLDDTLRRGLSGSPDLRPPIS
jgi:hypothetical protein